MNNNTRTIFGWCLWGGCENEVVVKIWVVEVLRERIPDIKRPSIYCIGITNGQYCHDIISKIQFNNFTVCAFNKGDGYVVRFILSCLDWLLCVV